MNRLPTSRQQKSTAALLESARPYLDHSIEGLRTKTALEVVYPSSSKHERAVYAVQTPLTQPRPVSSWPPCIQGDCLHCGDTLSKELYPIAKFKAENKFWVFGQFCSPCCALGYIREINLGCQVETWTRAMLQNVFAIHKFNVCPPRFCLKRYGGSMDKEVWKTIDFAAIIEPPMATFAMFAEASSRKGISQSISLQHLTRPTTRDTPLAVPTNNGREPLLLQLIAEAAPLPQEGMEKQPPKRAKKNLKTSQMLLDCN
jgi:hypothetical protein